MHKQIQRMPGPLTLLLAVCCFTNAGAQVQELEPSKAAWTTVGELKRMGFTKASLQFFVQRGDTTYLLRMQDEVRLKGSNDQTVRQYFSISFTGGGNAVNKLFDILNSFFTPEGKADKTLSKDLRLGKDLINVQHHTKLFAPAILLSTTKNNAVFTEKELHTLFGK